MGPGGHGLCVSDMYDEVQFSYLMGRGHGLDMEVIAEVALVDGRGQHHLGLVIDINVMYMGMHNFTMGCTKRNTC